MSKANEQLKAKPYIPYVLEKDAKKAGVYYYPPAENGEPKPKQWVCSPVEVVARTRDTFNLNHGRLLRWLDEDKKVHTWIMPKALLAGDGAEIRKTLLGLSLIHI